MEGTRQADGTQHVKGLDESIPQIHVVYKLTSDQLIGFGRLSRLVRLVIMPAYC